MHVTPPGGVTFHSPNDEQPVVYCCFLPSASLLPADFEFSFGQVLRIVGAGSDGSEASDANTPSDIGVQIVLNTTANFLTAITIVTVTVSGGTATGMPVSSL